MSSTARSTRSPRRALAAAAAIVTVAAGTYACNDSSSPAGTGTRLQYGAPITLGNGSVRSYVVLDNKDPNKPVEFGVAFDEAAMEGLPAPMAMPAGDGSDMHAHVDSHPYLLALPAQNPTPYKLIELDWNPAGHEPPGIYDIPHFDFHFYTITKAERDAIDPAIGDSAFLARSGNLPATDLQPQFYTALTAPGTPIAAVPQMGVHWVDVRSPELQGALGHPENAKPFTTTFLHGSWDGRFIFDEPMITRAFIMARKTATSAAAKDSVISVPVASKTAIPGYHPAAYHITYDAKTAQYRVALTQFALQQ